MVFSESYLTQPIAEFITVHHRGSISPEFNHPQFSTLSSGRPKQVDFALLTPNSSVVETVIEAKWVRDKPYPKQAILDDLLRLECFREDEGHVHRYFLIAGLRANFDTNFLELRYRDGKDLPFTTELLNPMLGSDPKTVGVFSIQGNLRNFYRKFRSDYGVELPRKFRTTLIARSRIDGLAVYLWKVGSMQKRSTLRPRSGELVIYNLTSFLFR